MHIAEGFLPASHAVGWTLAAAPFVAHGVRRLVRLRTEVPAMRPVLGAVGGFTLLLSSLKLPALGGSSSHPTGVALGAIVCGPAVMAAIGPPILLLQALLLAHGGLTTLGANTVSMAVVGPWVTWLSWRALAGVCPASVAIWVATMIGTLATYLTTAGQLALAFPDPATGIGGAFVKFAAILALVQLPLAAAEGVFTAAAWQVVVGRLPVPSRRSIGRA